MATTVTILCVDDEPQMLRFLRAALGSQGYAFVEARTGREGLALAASARPDVILLDLGLPDLDGLEVTRAIRAWTELPIIVLSARGQEADKVSALDAGADDYLTKPFGIPELLARIRVALRRAQRAQAGDEPVLHAADLEMDLPRRRVTKSGTEVKLTPIEFTLLTELMRHQGKVLTHQHLLRAAWGEQAKEELHYVRVYMAQLRRKLESDPAQPRLLLTEPGVGYRLAEDD